MANIIAVNAGAVNTGADQQLVDFYSEPILRFGDFTVIEDYRHYLRPNYLIKKINIKDDPSTNNKNTISDYFEGVTFIREGYSLKKITMEVLMIENRGKKYKDLIQEVKNFFADIKGILEYRYKGRLMQIEVTKESLIFGIYQDFKTFTITWIGQPFFKDPLQIVKTGTLDNPGEILEENEGQRADVLLEIEPESLTGGVQIGNFIVEDEIDNGDKITADFQTGKVFKNGVFIENSKGSLPVLHDKNIKIPVEFKEHVDYPSLNQILDSLNGLNGTSTYSVQYSNYDGRKIKHLFPTNNITYLKEIVIGFENEFNYSNRLWVILSSGGTTLYTASKEFYAGEYYEFEKEKFVIDGVGLDVSAYDELFLTIRIQPLQTAGSSDFIWKWLRTSTGSHGLGTSYDNDDEEVDWTRNIELRGLDQEYKPITTNTSKFNYKLEYFNKFL